MVIELTPETFFEKVNVHGPLNVVMHYGINCGPCKLTMPNFDAVAGHFEEHNITNVKFYKFHQWDENYKEFVETNNINVNGVPTFRYYYVGEIVNEETRAFFDGNELKQHILSTVHAITTTLGDFNLYATTS